MLVWTDSDHQAFSFTAAARTQLEVSVARFQPADHQSSRVLVGFDSSGSGFGSIGRTGVGLGASRAWGRDVRTTIRPRAGDPEGGGECAHERVYERDGDRRRPPRRVDLD